MLWWHPWPYSQAVLQQVSGGEGRWPSSLPLASGAVACSSPLQTWFALLPSREISPLQPLFSPKSLLSVLWYPQAYVPPALGQGAEANPRWQERCPFTHPQHPLPVAGSCAAAQRPVPNKQWAILMSYKCCRSKSFGLYIFLLDCV